MYLIYLRKSRADEELETISEMETLARHEQTLTELAKLKNLEVGAIYKEIVSGDSIAQRPQMQRLIQEVSAGMWQGVIVMEIERLARGDTIDQGIVAQAFKYSNTLIITPSKVYDPNNEFDETFFEFNLFMSRQEYKTIKRRLLAGRISSVKEGNYLGSKNPYGYRKIKDGKDITLEIVPEEALIINRMYRMYVEENKGFTAIATELLSEGIKLGGYTILAHKIKDIIHNPLYKGYVTFGRHKEYYAIDENGIRTKHWTSQNEYIIAKGKHQPIVSEEMWNKAQVIADNRWHSSKSKDAPMRNRLTSLLVCGNCGRAMRLKRSQPKQATKPYYSYLCAYCKSVKQSTEAVVLEAVNQAIISRFENLKLNPVDNTDNNEIEIHTSAIANARTELKKLKEQKAKICEFYEREIYDDETYEERIASVKERETQLQAILSQKLTKKVDLEQVEINFRDCIDNFDTDNHEEMNKLYKSIINKIEYLKESRQSDFILNIHFII